MNLIPKKEKEKYALSKYITNFPKMEDIIDYSKILDIGPWKIPTPTLQKTIQKPKKPKIKHSSDKDRREYILRPLDEVILNPQLLDDIIVISSISINKPSARII